MVGLNTRPMDDQQLDGRCEISVHSELTYYVDHTEYFIYMMNAHASITHNKYGELDLPLHVVT